MQGDFVITLPSLIFVCFLVGLAGFVDAAAGGGGLISLPAYIFTGMPVHFAMGCNKLSASCGTTLAVFKFWKDGALNIRTAVIAAVGSFTGSATGARIALMLSDHFLKTIMLFIIPCAAALIFLKRDLGDEDLSMFLGGKRSAVFAFAIGFFIGGYDGLVGPGTGTFAIIAFSVIMGYDLRTASGNSKMLNLASNYASLITFAAAGTIYYKVAIPAAVCGIIGNYMGSACALTKGSKFIKPMIVIVLTMLLGKMLIDIIL